MRLYDVVLNFVHVVSFKTLAAAKLYVLNCCPGCDILAVEYPKDGPK